MIYKGYRTLLDELVIKYYRKLLRHGFKHTGTIESPSIFLDSIGENIPICAQVAQSYIHLYINIDTSNTIDDIKYLCMCDPTANVAVEVLCTLVEGKTIEEVGQITEKSFAQEIGSEGKDYIKSARGLLELMNRGLMHYLDKTSD
jgi:NifU-like protein involved in Fe-S cluster formation